MDGQNASEVRPAAWRLFIALPVPEEVRVEIQRAQDQLRHELPKLCARWTRPEQFHLTLKFLGNVDEARIGALAEAVAAAGAVFAPMKLRAERVGCFPDLRFPRVVWVGIHDAHGHLASLAGAIETATAAFSHEARETNFAGHITIARLKNLKRPQAELLAKLVSRMGKCMFGDWIADSIDIMRSELAAGGARHTCLRRLSLGATAGQGAG